MMTPATRGHAARTPLRSTGLVAGLGLGVAVGVLIAGPHFHDWSALTSAALILASAGLGALVGYLMTAASPRPIPGAGADTGLAGGSVEGCRHGDTFCSASDNAGDCGGSD